MDRQLKIRRSMKTRLRKAVQSVLCLVLLAAFSAPIALAAGSTMLVPMGNVVGISIATQGVIVVQIAEYKSESGSISPARDAGIQPGDIIIEVNGKETLSADKLREVMNSFKGGKLPVCVCRGGVKKTLSVTPHLSDDGKYELGLWLRDGMSGLGTLTYFNPDNHEFGALGHPINEIDTGVFVPVRNGDILKAKITEVVMGLPGTPGQLHGAFEKDKILGSIADNSDCGLFGTITDMSLTQGLKAIPVADSSEIMPGKASILSNIEGGAVKEYAIEISRVYTGAGTESRNMMIIVTDERLLQVAGGIVQGMSGSPIIQNGKLVGAVTHVLINDPTKGYGIAIENMLGKAETLRNAAA